ncbi:hypothetical protein [Leptothoe kymatousa]|uniref:Uncharacterized protein n=1 Tax=Leptothoe kymatousa TAU-MAC 1615 TaxID=2364775 RepID=A0ABS5Y768_9CYAN|nr:hypothetical protein [Leptothoe kymatousa]MBT9313672.1 hypothetical protein [Leptothoe kymatousa TAU-MAC 1615]
MEQLFARVNRLLQVDIKSLVRTVEDPQGTLLQMIMEMSEGIEQFRQEIDIRIANQQTLEAEDNLQHHTHKIGVLRSALLRLDTKLTEAKWLLSNLEGDA